jgi:hypothetical protein
VPSSKGLHLHKSQASTTKLNRRHTSPSPGEYGSIASTHRRAVSEVNLSRDQSSSNLKKNASHTSLKRNRSKADIGKKSKSTTGLGKRSSTGSVAPKHKSSHYQVHFNLGDDDDQDEIEQEDEWVDASTSASPRLSRHTSVLSGGQSSADPPASASNSRPQSPPGAARTSGANHAPPSVDTSNTTSAAHSPDKATTDHNRYLTSRLLQRTPSIGAAPPMMSTQNVSARPPSSRQHSPESRGSRETISTPSGTPGAPTNVQSGSSGKAELTSRFVSNGSQGSGSAVTGDSFVVPVNRMTRGMNGKNDSALPRRPRSMGSLSHADGRQVLSSNLTDDEDDEDAENGGLAAGSRSRRNGAGHAVPRSDMNRTQQKLNLQRASSSLEPNHHPGIGMGLAGVAAGAGPLVGASGYETRDPRLGKLLERTGMEYLLVRRHQNPVARSLARLGQIPGADKGRRIPKPGSSSASVGGHSRRGSDYGSIRSAARDRDLRDPSVASLITGHGSSSRRPSTPHMALHMTRSNGVGVNGDTDDGPTGLSGSSLVDRGEDAQTMALLRNLWDRNMDLSASQE